MIDCYTYDSNQAFHLFLYVMIFVLTITLMTTVVLIWFACERRNRKSGRVTEQVNRKGQRKRKMSKFRDDIDSVDLRSNDSLSGLNAESSVISVGEGFKYKPKKKK